MKDYIVVNKTNDAQVYYISNRSVTTQSLAKIQKKSYLWKVESKILRQLCDTKLVDEIEVYAMKAHIHILLKITLKLSVLSFIGYLKGRLSLMIFERHQT